MRSGAAGAVPVRSCAKRSPPVALRPCLWPRLRQSTPLQINLFKGGQALGNARSSWEHSFVWGGKSEEEATTPSPRKLRESRGIHAGTAVFISSVASWLKPCSFREHWREDSRAAERDARSAERQREGQAAERCEQARVAASREFCQRPRLRGELAPGWLSTAPWGAGDVRARMSPIQRKPRGSLRRVSHEG